VNGRKLLVALAAVLLLVSLAPLALAAATLTVQTGAKYYNAGDVVAIKGTAPAGASVNINVNATTGSVYTMNIVANTTGTYNSPYTLPATADLGIYKVTATSGNNTASTVFMVTSVSVKSLAQQLINAAAMSQTLAQETIHSVKDSNVTLPAAVNSTMTQGAKALASAQSLYASGNYVAASESAQRAMNQFKNAMTLALKTAKVEANIYEQRFEILQRQVDRMTSDAERISQVLSNLDDAGKNVTAARAKVADANASLILANTLIAGAKYDEAVTAAKAAKESLQAALQLIRPLIQSVRRDMMDKFRLNLQQRVNATQGDFEKLKEKLKNTNMNSMMGRLGSVNGLIQSAKTKMGAGDDDEAVNDLVAASNDLTTTISTIGDTGYSQGMMQTNTIRAQIQVLQDLVKTMKKQGKDTSAIDAKITELQSSLDQGLGKMMGGDVSSANKILEDAGKKGSNYSGMGSHKNGMGMHG
jgi:tetratricopeptide (TPR) repeat protein